MLNGKKRGWPLEKDYVYPHQCFSPSPNIFFSSQRSESLFFLERAYQQISKSCRNLAEAMAPLVETAIQWLLGSVAINQSPSPIPAEYSQKVETVAATKPFSGIQLSTVSWSHDRNDVFGVGYYGDVIHKFWDGYQWRPSITDLESLGGDLHVPPVAVSWGPNRNSIFAIGNEGALYHTFWDGSRWQPDYKDWEILGANISTSYSFAATAWAENRLDVFTIGPSESGGNEVWHKYWDGSSWRPEGAALESLGAKTTSGPAAVSWGKNRNDVVVLGEGGNLLHTYWDGSNWAAWENFGGKFVGTPTIISWGENRLDIFAIHSDSAKLYHKYWDGSRWSEWEDFGGIFVGTVGATSWEPNRIDIVAWGRDDQQYYYKYWDGYQWNPSATGWSSKGGKFSSSPSVVSWGKDRLDIFGLWSDNTNQLTHQTWWGSGWYPGYSSWERLGGSFRQPPPKVSAEKAELK